ncbi:MAG: hypothetical protein ACYDAI_19555 [Trichloromonadaceae bacterium]
MNGQITKQGASFGTFILAAPYRQISGGKVVKGRYFLLKSIKAHPGRQPLTQISFLAKGLDKIAAPQNAIVMRHHFANFAR